LSPSVPQQAAPATAPPAALDLFGGLGELSSPPTVVAQPASASNQQEDLLGLF